MEKDFELICDGYGFLSENTGNELKIVCLSGNKLYYELFTKAKPQEVFIYYHKSDFQLVLLWALKNNIDISDFLENKEVPNFSPSPFKLIKDRRNGNFYIDLV